MPFGLTNAPATFQTFLNNALREYRDSFCMIDLDDILIYSMTEEEHTRHVRAVLTKLPEVGVFCKPEKCEFHVPKTDFVGYAVSGQGVSRCHT